MAVLVILECRVQITQGLYTKDVFVCIVPESVSKEPHEHTHDSALLALY